MKIDKVDMKLFLAFGLLVCGVNLSLFAQETENEENGEIKGTEILILKDRQLTLPVLEKIFDKTRMSDNQLQPEVRPNIFKPFSYQLQKSNPNIKAAKPKGQSNTEYYESYVKAGTGNYGSVLLGAGLYFPVDENKTIGLNFDHLSYKEGAVTGNKSSQSSAELFGKVIGKKAVFSSNLSFSRVEEAYYGYIIPDNFASIDVLSFDNQKFNLINFDIQLDDNNKKDIWEYSISLDYKNISDNFSSSESRFSAKSSVEVNEKIGLDIEFNSSKYKLVEELSRSYFRLTPYYIFEIGALKLDAGVSYNLQNDTTSLINSTKVFPYLFGRYQLPQSYEVFAKLDGGFNYKSYWEVASENPYVDSNLTIQNEEVVYDFEFGIKGKPVQKLGTELSVRSQLVENKAVYVNNGLFGAKFSLLYLSEPTRITTLGGKFNYHINNKNQVGINFLLANYSNDLGSLPHVPTSKFEINGNHWFSEKIKMNWNFQSLNGIKAVGFESGEERTISVQNLTISGQYFINEKLNVFIEMDNVLNQNNERYLNYQLREFQLRAGLFYKF